MLRLSTAGASRNPNEETSGTSIWDQRLRFRMILIEPYVLGSPPCSFSDNR